MALAAASPEAHAAGVVQLGGSENRLCASSNSGEVGQEVTNCSPPQDDNARNFSHSVSSDTASGAAGLTVGDRPDAISVGTEGGLRAFGDGIDPGDDRQESATARLSRSFTVTTAVPYRIALELAAEVGTAPFGDRGSVVVSVVGTESGSGDVFEVSRARARSTGVPADTGELTGTLDPGDYRFLVESHCQVASERCETSWGATLAVGPPDEDGDALPDRWETQGVDVDDNGSIDLDLPAMGADPRHKDIFVELDFMPPHRFELSAGTQIAKAFADAPVSNPDGTTGIALHLDNGTDSVMDPRTDAVWGSRSRQTSISHQDVLGSVEANAYDWGPFDALKAAHFPSARRDVFHYAISGHGHNGHRSGIARDIPSSELLVTLGAGCLANAGADCTLDPTAQAGTLMHELGHNLGLHHGGDDDLLDKPNYLSVMNYNFQLIGLMRADLTFLLDYSRFAIGPLDEDALDEAHGFGVTSGPAASFSTFGRCPGGGLTNWLVADGPTDFDCSPLTGTIAADINGDGARTTLRPFVDWPALVFAGGAIGGSGVALPAQTPLMEPPLEDLLDRRKFIEDYVASQKDPDPPVTPGEPATTATPTAPAASTPAAVTPVAITALSLRPARFRAAPRGPSIGGRGGAAVTYTITAAARVRFTVERLLKGRRRAGRCRPPRQAPRGKRCARRVAARGSFTHTGAAGTNTFRFRGRLAGRTLAPGGYRLLAAAITPDDSPATGRAASFKIRR